jgi:hypothetical protein
MISKRYIYIEPRDIRMMTKMTEKEIMGLAFDKSPAALAARVAGFIISQESRRIEINGFANGVEFVGVSRDPTKSMNGGEYTETLTVYHDGSFVYGTSAEFAFCPYTGTYDRCDDGPMHGDHHRGVTL